MGFTMSKNVLISSRLSLLHLILGYLDNLDFLSYLKNLKQRSTMNLNIYLIQTIYLFKFSDVRMGTWDNAVNLKTSKVPIYVSNYASILEIVDFSS